jgi:PTS system cellobiose-specific IIB component
MLVEKMREAAKAKGVDVFIEACAEIRLNEVIAGTDVVVLAPQVRLKKDGYDQKYAGNPPFMVVDAMDYGMLNGEKVLSEAIGCIKKQ